jgi:hypothetical protein
LETELGKTVPTPDGARVARKRLIAQMMAEIVTTGRVTMLDGRALEVKDLEEYANIVKWLYKHIDGEKSQVDVTSAGGRVGVLGIEIVPPPHDLDADTPE